MTWFHPHHVARRARASEWIIAAVFGVLAIAFFRLQILGASRYRLQSEENRLRPVHIPAPRGLLTDRNGLVLAENVPGYTVSLLASSTDSLRAALQRIAPIAGLDSARIAALVRRFRRSPYEPLVIHRDAPFDLVSSLEERRVTIPGLVIQTEPKRRYPYGPLAAHAVGYVGEITERELASGAFVDARLGALIGRSGLEQQYDARLRGKDGVRFVEVDALGRTVREDAAESDLAPQQGETIRTSLDIELQRYVMEVFPPDKLGALVVMEPKTGEILAMYSSPTYDPNAFIGGIDPEEWRRLERSEDHPLLNRAIQARYPPASPWKLLMAAFAMRRGVATLNTRMTFPCRGGFQYGTRYFRCWKVDGHGDVTLAEAIQHSCDVFFYQLGIKLGLTNLLQDGMAIGARARAGIDLPNELMPEFPPSEQYYNRRFGPRGWTSAVTLNLAIGQGENSQTLIGMMRFYAMLANEEGSAPSPHLAIATGAPDAPSPLGLDRDQLSGLRQALLSVVESGTATRSRIADLHIAGKTGTAQNAHGLDHGWFIGFAPAESPRVVVGTIVEFAEHGSSVAPIVTRVIARHLLGEEAGRGMPGDYILTVPADTSPGAVPILPDTTRRGRGTGGEPRPR